MAAAGRFDGQAFARSYRAIAIELPTERINDTSQQFIAHCYIHDTARALDFISRVKMPVFAEQNDANSSASTLNAMPVPLPGNVTSSSKTHNRGKTRHFGDTSGDTRYRTHFA